ncbi:hypothetical protein LJK87_39800 [Paenibacillus sp. P25]|nr:hypothetical protein LJK87_39800 [Paenibacillus sp. P25]
MDTSSRLTTEINEPGFEVAPADLEALRDQLKELLKETGVLVLGGSLPKGVSEDVYAGLVQARVQQELRRFLMRTGPPSQRG